MGAPSFWQANVIVANIDESVAKVKSLGGQVFHVETVPNVGKLAVIADPQGTAIALFTPEGSWSFDRGVVIPALGALLGTGYVRFRPLAP